MNTPAGSSTVISRRGLLQFGTGATVAALLGKPAEAFASTGLDSRPPPPELLARLGVRPFINGTSTRTMNGGSAMLPEVVAAMHAAAFHPVNLQELLPRAGARIAELLQAPAAVIASGAAGAMTLATLAVMSGGDFEVLLQLPDTRGLRDEVVCHRPSRSIYDQAIRMTGARMVDVASPVELDRAFTGRTFLAYAGLGILAGDSRISAERFLAAAHARGIPVLLDAATDLPVAPDPHLQRGFDLVAYSGGKSLKGPQGAGLLLCRRPELAQAAYIAGAPHHTFARPMKVTKEEILGIVAAVEALGRSRVIAAEFEEHRRWFRHIIARITQVPGVSARIVEASRAGEYPVMEIAWDPARIGLVARQLGAELLRGEPRIMTHAWPKEIDPTSMETHTFQLRSMALYPGEYRLVAERLYQVFKDAPGPQPPPTRAPAQGRLAGGWDLEIAFVAGTARHRLELTHEGHTIGGRHIGRLTAAPVAGEIDGARVTFESRGMYQAADIRYFFSGTLAGDTLSGEVGLGEYGAGRWTAHRAG